MLNKYMKLVFEIGLNHMGDEVILDRYLNQLGRLNFKFILTIQIINNTFIKKKITKKILSHDLLIKKISMFGKKFNQKIGIATDVLLEKKVLEKYNIKFIKILTKDFDNIRLISHYLNFKHEVYISTGGKTLNQITKKNNTLSRCYKNHYFIITDFTDDPKKLSFSKINKLKKHKINQLSYGIHYKNFMPGYLSAVLRLNKLFIYVKLIDNLDYPDNSHAIKVDNLNYFYNELKYCEKLSID